MPEESSVPREPSWLPRSRDAEEEDIMQYGADPPSENGILEAQPVRPRNHSRTPFFSTLFTDLFNPLNENKTQSAGFGGPGHRRRGGRGGASKLSPHEQRRVIIQRFMARWRAEVGDDFYPALRLIIPDKDRDRGAYGLKENTIGKLLVKLMKISSESEDGLSLLRWKVPGQTLASRMAGDFAGRCFEVLSRREMRSEPGALRIARVNQLLDQLAAASGEAGQLPVFRVFYEAMNAEELMWLIRIILRQLKVGATERTLLDLWHPDGEALFSVSSSLRRVCWELWDRKVRLGQDETGVALMQCFQPQLAQFQTPASFERMVELLRPQEGDSEFWIEEKLDGERVQMHMAEDATVPGRRRFRFWSRKGKDYTYLYGSGLEEGHSALTRHLALAFDPAVRNVILDGEMVTWDPKVDKVVPFGTLKTAALLGQAAMADDESNERPLFRVFDILYLNGVPLTGYTLRDRRKALERAVPGACRRLEVHPHEVATSAAAIEPLLRRVIAESSEGLVLKNPRSAYRLNSRNDDWLKVKPEYMSEFGESLDCLVIGGYFGSGRRGGTISSFLCGLRAGENDVRAGEGDERCISFFKVGGGFRTEDYAQIRHLSEGKWRDWNPAHPPSEYIELGGGEKLQYERPDVWIRPRDSFVMSVKAASVGPSDQFGTNVTLRFPRFRRLRTDRSWNQALDLDGFARLRKGAELQAKERTEMKIEDRKRRPKKRPRRELMIAGQSVFLASKVNTLRCEVGSTSEGGPAVTHPAVDECMVFHGHEFCVLSESLEPAKITKAQIESLIKSRGGLVSQKVHPGSSMYLVADKNVVKVASLLKMDVEVDIVRPKWITDCLSQGGGECLLPLEEGHLYRASESTRQLAARSTDEFGDSYARDTDVHELQRILAKMSKAGSGCEFDKGSLFQELREKDDLTGAKGSIFRRCVMHLAVADVVTGGGKAGFARLQAERLENIVRFGGGAVVADKISSNVTHVVVVAQGDRVLRELAGEIRRLASTRSRLPRLTTQTWVEECWKQGTRIDEELFAPP